MRVDWIEVQKATVISKKFPSNRHAREMLDAALYRHSVAHTAWMAAIDISNELYLHDVSEMGTQTGDTEITGSGNAFVVQDLATLGKGSRSG